MSQVLVTESSLSGIADAIRAKLGVETEYKPGEMAAAILSIPSGGGGDAAQIPPIAIPTNQFGTYLNIVDGWIKNFTVYGFFIPLDSQENKLDVDWSNPFEICVSFIRTQISSHSMVLFGSEYGTFCYTPSIELSGNGTDIWCGFSVNGQSWGYSIRFSVSDFTLQSNVKYTITATWDGEDYTVTLTDGTSTVTKSVTPSRGHYHVSSYNLCFGGMMHSSNHVAQYVNLYLPDMYIKSNGTYVWQGHRDED